MTGSSLSRAACLLAIALGAGLVAAGACIAFVLLWGRADRETGRASPEPVRVSEARQEDAAPTDRAGTPSGGLSAGRAAARAYPMPPRRPRVEDIPGLTPGVRAFLGEKFVPCITHDCIESKLTKEDVPALHRAFEMACFVDKRYHILFAICLLDAPENAYRTVTSYVERYENYRDYPKEFFDRYPSVDLLYSKALCLRLLGYLPKEIGSDYLQDAFTKEGARRVLADWHPQPEVDFHIHAVRSAAARGLAMLQDEEAFRCVEEEYKRLRRVPFEDLSRAEQRDVGICVEAVYLRDLIAEKGVDEGRSFLEQVWAGLLGK